MFDQGGEEALKQQGQGGGGRDPFDLFSSFFGGGGRAQQQEERRGADVHLDLPVTLEDLYVGRVHEVLVRQAHLCPHCRGSGARSESDVHKCHACQGRGVQIKVVSLGPGFMQQVQQPCDVCQGRGKVIKAKCPRCSGAKTVRGSKKLDVHVEAGMGDGSRIEFEHAADEHPEHAAGHVIFTVRTAPHPRFRREGDNLHYTQVISLKEVSSKDSTQLSRCTHCAVHTHTDTLFFCCSSAPVSARLPAHDHALGWSRSSDQLDGRDAAWRRAATAA